jgi:hypothetical protein
MSGSENNSKQSRSSLPVEVPKEGETSNGRVLELRREAKKKLQEYEAELSIDEVFKLWIDDGNSSEKEVVNILTECFSAKAELYCQQWIEWNDKVYQSEIGINKKEEYKLEKAVSDSNEHLDKIFEFIGLTHVVDLSEALIVPQILKLLSTDRGEIHSTNDEKLSSDKKKLPSPDEEEVCFNDVDDLLFDDDEELSLVGNIKRPSTQDKKPGLVQRKLLCELLIESSFEIPVFLKPPKTAKELIESERQGLKLEERKVDKKFHDHEQTKPASRGKAVRFDKRKEAIDAAVQSLKEILSNQGVSDFDWKNIPLSKEEFVHWLRFVSEYLGLKDLKKVIIDNHDSILKRQLKNKDIGFRRSNGKVSKEEILKFHTMFGFKFVYTLRSKSKGKDPIDKTPYQA